ncbi:MAG: Gfo/Idh/MocA family oxidoreductase [Clostridiales bacterium]|nr:Gfo/Idh/MocA family oxidoreductase [Clostridiales bacterium]
MDRVRVGVIGLGWFGEMHLTAYKGVHGAKVEAVCTRRPDRLAEIAEKHGITKTYTDYHDLLADPDIDAVSICTHARDHLQPMLDAMASGKHVLLEKPMSASIEECDTILEASKECTQNLMVGHICRFENDYAVARDEILSGRIGDIVSIYSRRNVGGSRAFSHLQVLSSITGDIVHDIDLMNWFLGKKAKSVYGMASFTRGDIAYPDIGWVNIKYDGGALAVAESCWNLPDGSPYPIDAKMEVVGTKGVIYLFDPSQPLVIDDGQRREIKETVYWPVVNGKIGGALHAELQYFTDCILNGEKPTITTLQESRDVIEICNAAEESAKTGQVVLL